MIFWVGFHLLIGALLALDLGVFRRGKVKYSWYLSAFWVFVALFFNGYIYLVSGREVATQFFTGYLIEKSLSIDNLFVFLMIFSSFQICEEGQGKVLFWGVLGAIVFRLIFILSGIALIEKFDWLLTLLGGFLIFSGLKIFYLTNKPRALEVSKGYLLLKKILPVSDGKGEGNFWVKEGGKWKMTPLFVVLLLIEGNDLVFALDSVPAVFAVTRDPFIAYTSNIFAVLGLRALYFCLSPLLANLSQLKIGLGGILFFVGTKMAIHKFYQIPLWVSLGIILAILAVTVFFSAKRR